MIHEQGEHSKCLIPVWDGHRPIKMKANPVKHTNQL